MQIKTLSNTVEAFLIKFPSCRDSDSELISRIWAHTLRAKGEDPHQLTAAEFLRIHAKGSMLPHSESIRRCRQKLQEENESLRGEAYKGRKTHKEESVKEQIRNW